MILSDVLVYTCLEEMVRVQFSFAIIVDNVTLYTSDAVYAALRRYATYSYIDAEANITKFSAAWTAWISQQGHDLKCAYDALRASYNPIANYDMTETEGTGHQRDGDHTTSTPSGTATMTSTIDKAGFDSSAAVLSDVNTSTQSYTDYNVQTDSTHDNTLTRSDELPASYNEVTDRTLSRSGNIGVTTSQQMIESELNLRQQDLLENFVHRFMKKHCHLIDCTPGVI